MILRRTLVLLSILAISQITSAQHPYKLTEPAPMESGEYRTAIQKSLNAIYGMQGDVSFVAVRSGPGETASGVVVHETRDFIAIDMTPCAAKKNVRYFVAPYRKSSVTDEQCGSKTFSRVQVIQLAPVR